MFTFSELRARADVSLRGKVHAKTANALLLEAKESFSAQQYDIFLSHSHLDAEVVLGLKLEFERLGFSVYVYWIADPQSQHAVTKETADRLRQRMKSCRCLLYAASENSPLSKWMPWEVGYFDAFRQRVAVVPIQQHPGFFFEGFKGQEYLELYPYLSPFDLNGLRTLYVWTGPGFLRDLRKWIVDGVILDVGKMK